MRCYKLSKEKLGRNHEQQIHATSNTNTNFAGEKEETNRRVKNSKWTVSYELSIYRLYEEKKKGRNKEEVKEDKIENF